MKEMSIRYFFRVNTLFCSSSNIQITNLNLFQTVCCYISIWNMKDEDIQLLPLGFVFNTVLCLTCVVLSLLFWKFLTRASLKGPLSSAPIMNKQPKLIKCFALEIPEWLKVYAKASPNLDQYLKVRYWVKFCTK